MDQQCYEVLQKIFEATKNITDGWCPSVNINLRSSERVRVCETLIQHGFISDVDYIGQTYISCRVTNKVLEQITFD